MSAVVRVEPARASSGFWALQALTFLILVITAQSVWTAIHLPASPSTANADLDIRRGAFLAGQKRCLTQAVYYEARGETLEGQQAVAQVVLNRVREPGFPKTICDVVFQGAERGRGCQFSFACDGSMKRDVAATAWSKAETVAAEALSGRFLAEVGSATHYHARRVSPAWSRKLHRVGRIGAHIFYAQAAPSPAHVA